MYTHLLMLRYGMLYKSSSEASKLMYKSISMGSVADTSFERCCHVERNCVHSTQVGYSERQDGH
jgi:hypothetical protein